MIRFPLTRRSLLKAVGAQAALLPLLDATTARAAGSRKRFIVIGKGGGTFAPGFWPRATSADLSALTLPAGLAPLEPLRKDVIVVGGLELKSGVRTDQHRAYTGMITRREPRPQGEGGRATAESLDWAIAQHLARTDKRPFDSLIVGVGMDDSHPGAFTSFREGGQVNTPEHDPYRLFDKLFAKGVNGGAPDPEAGRLRLQRRSVLDFAGARLERYAQRLGGEDRARIEAHLTSVRAIEKQLASVDPSRVTCAAPRGAGPEDPRIASAPRTPGLSRNVPTLLKLHSDLILAAMRCDLTRVAAMNLGDGYGNALRFEWLNLPVPNGCHFHFLRHHDFRGVTEANFLAAQHKVEAWFVSAFAYFCQQLKATPEGGGTMLDNSVVLYADAQGNGRIHSAKGCGWIIGGRGGGYFKPGQLLRLGGWASAPADGYWRAGGHVSQNGILNSIAVAFGLGESWADPKFGTGELSAARA